MACWLTYKSKTHRFFNLLIYSQKHNPMQNTRRILRQMNSEMLLKTFKVAELEVNELKLMQLFYIKEWKRDYICDELGLSRSTFNRIKNNAELKIKISLTNLLNEKLAQMSKKLEF